MLIRFWLFTFLTFLTFFTFQVGAEENISAPTVAEEKESSDLNQIKPDTVEVGRHVIGNIDAGSMILSLLAVLIAIAIAAWILKKLQVGGISVNGLKVVTSLSLGSKERLVVVQVGKKQLLLGVTAQQINILDTLVEPIEINNGVPLNLSQTLARFGRNPADKANSEKYS
jgi:flagellar protein FliO/FliZ